MQKSEMNPIKETNLDHQSGVDAVQDQIAHNIVELLEIRSQALKPAEATRLCAARNLAVEHLASLQAATHRGVNRDGNALQWFGHHRAILTTVLVGALLAALFAVQQSGFNRNLEHSDAFLLASDLPPEAYADKGFNAWVDSN